MNKNDLLGSKIKEKMGDNWFAAKVSGMVSNLVTNEKIMQTVGDKLKEEVPKKIRDGGRKRFRRGREEVPKKTRDGGRRGKEQWGRTTSELLGDGIINDRRCENPSNQESGSRA